MTTADHANAWGRSLFGWGTLEPNAERRPSLSDWPGGRAVAVSAHNTNARTTEYVTYAPDGEKCRKCRRPFQRLEQVRRVMPTGEPCGRPYVCMDCSGGSGGDE